MSFHGNPCWYELATSDLTAAGQFYDKVLGWTVANSGMPASNTTLPGWAMRWSRA